MQVETNANIEASMQSGMTCVIWIVIGTTARQVKVARSINISSAFNYQSEMIDHHGRLAPEVKTSMFKRIKLAYMRQVLMTWIHREIFISFQVCTLVRYWAKIYIPTMAPTD